MSDALVEDVVVEDRAASNSVPLSVLDDLDLEGEPLEDVVDELDGGALVEARVDAQDPEAGAVVDGGELVVLPSWPALDGRDELDGDLDLVFGELLLLALPAAVEPLVAL